METKEEIPQFERVELITTIRNFFPRLDKKMLDKWSVDLSKQDVTTLEDVLMLEPESLNYLAKLITVKCYDCLFKLKNKCLYLRLHVSKEAVTGTIPWENINGIYGTIPNVYFNKMPLLKQISGGCQYCIYHDAGWRVIADDARQREKGNWWLLSNDEILNTKGTCKWTYYCTEAKKGKYCENIIFNVVKL
ncbi:hypothetical protein RFI_15404 [Reticulomyxa filosa]|uniref:Uncharacterized protein n=1 Tax=Reticulomyxa filosa TaxID=46433 RepID=X6N7A8_RETFI|nr:hypothetical protein RFI_15404 [Reticulomyxa filosa]|eukprot:ETO21798.1 hypothetical protein RFI_15404 [Reticulomyxa filosa]